MAASHLEEGVDVTSGARVLECVVVTPEETTLQTPAQFIALPLFDGEIGIAPGRAPLIGRLGFGEMRIREGNNLYRYYVDGGFVEVSGNMVSILTQRAIPAEELDQAEIESTLVAAQQKPANTPETIAIRDRAVAQARGQQWVARSRG
ncbi:MAG: ATP synthase F1 subunit epsilon [Planctomycetales bacterium]|jgi:F-type H+-transporting ATPase subunit epsilon